MTAEELRAMDAEIHRKVMGRAVVLDGYFQDFAEPANPAKPEYPRIVPRYSTDIKAAWLVVEEMSRRVGGAHVRYPAALERLGLPVR